MKTEGHERKEGKKCLWGRMKGEPNERGKPMTVQTSLRNLLQKPSLLVNTPRARKGGREGGKEKEGEKEAKVFPATAQASKDTPKGRAPSYDESIQGRPRKRVKRGKREGKKERGREGERRERKVFPATNNRAGTHQRRKGEILSISFRKTPKSKERKGGGKGEEGGLSSPQVPMNLKLALTAMVTFCPAEMAGCFDRCGHVKA